MKWLTLTTPCTEEEGDLLLSALYAAPSIPSVDAYYGSQEGLLEIFIGIEEEEK